MHAIVTLCLIRRVFQIFDFKDVVTFKIRLESLKVTGNVTCIETIARVVWDLQYGKMSWLWKDVRGHSRSFLVIPFDR